MDVTTWMAFALASTALLLIPGPTVLLVLSYAIGHGRKVALSTALGVALGDLIAMTVSLAGLGTLILASATLFTVLKWLGAAYLIYLGVTLWRSAGSQGLTIAAQTTQRGIFWHSCLVTALNPKSIAFFIAFVPQFIAPSAPLVPQFAVMIATFVGLAGVFALSYAMLAAALRGIIGRPLVIANLTRLGAATLVAMGIATAALRRG